MATPASQHSEVTAPAVHPRAGSAVPWQIWIVVVLLGLEGLGNLISIPDNPAAVFWLAAKCLFIVGLLKGWRWVYGLFLVVAVIHVVYFLPILPIASLMNLVLMGLAVWARRYYFEIARR